MFTNFKLFRKVKPVEKIDESTSVADQQTVDVAGPMSEPDTVSKDATAQRLPTAEDLDRMRHVIGQAQAFFADRAQLGIGMACNAMEDPVQLRGFVDFNVYDVKAKNQSFWKLQTQSGMMFGQLSAKGAFVYPAEATKNLPFDDSKLGRGLASFGSQFQPEVAEARPVLKPVGSVPIDRIEQAMAFCKDNRAAVAIALLTRELPDGAQCELATVRRLQTLEKKKKRISLGLRLRNSLGVTKTYRLLLDAEKAVLVDQDTKVVGSVKAADIQKAATDCQID